LNIHALAIITSRLPPNSSPYHRYVHFKSGLRTNLVQRSVDNGDNQLKGPGDEIDFKKFDNN
jgi:hypothetical protein